MVVPDQVLEIMRYFSDRAACAFDELVDDKIERGGVIGPVSIPVLLVITNFWIIPLNMLISLAHPHEAGAATEIINS